MAEYFILNTREDQISVILNKNHVLMGVVIFRMKISRGINSD